MTVTMHRWVAVLAGLSLCLVGCGQDPKGKPPAPPTPADKPSASANDPERLLADAMAHLMKNQIELEAIDKSIAGWNEKFYKGQKIYHHNKWLHDVWAADPSIEGASDACHMALWKKILGKHNPALAARLEKGDLTMELLKDGRMICEDCRARVPSADIPIPAVPDKAKALAELFAQWVREYAEPQNKMKRLQKEYGEKSMPVIEQKFPQVIGAPMEAWVYGGGPSPEWDPAETIRALMRKHHPEFADALADMIKEEMVSAAKQAQRDLAGELKAIHEAELRFHELDVDGNGVKDYWTGDFSGLYRLLLEGEPLQLIPTGLAAADTAPLPAGAMLAPVVPKAVIKPGKAIREGQMSAFVFRMVPLDAEGKPFSGAEGVSAHRNPDRYAVSACPAVYGRAGRQTYLLNEKGEIWYKDTDGKPIERLPKDPAADGWTASESPAEKRDVQRAFGGLPLGFLIKKLQATELEVRISALLALGSCRNPWPPTITGREPTPEARKAVQEMLKDSDEAVKKAAREALDEMDKKVEKREE